MTTSPKTTRDEAIRIALDSAQDFINSVHYGKCGGLRNEVQLKIIAAREAREALAQQAADDKAGGEVVAHECMSLTCMYVDGLGRSDCDFCAPRNTRPQTQADDKAGGEVVADAHLAALMRYTAAFYGSAIEHGMKAGPVADCVAHVERAARALHAMASRPQPQADELQEIASYVGVGGFNGATTEQLVKRIKDEFQRLTGLQSEQLAEQPTVSTLLSEAHTALRNLAAELRFYDLPYDSVAYDQAIRSISNITRHVTSDPEPCSINDHSKYVCKNRHQCWEPCGELGHSVEHARPASKETSEAIDKALGIKRGSYTCLICKCSSPYSHGLMDDGKTVCPNSYLKGNSSRIK